MLEEEWQELLFIISAGDDLGEYKYLILLRFSITYKYHLLRAY